MKDTIISSADKVIHFLGRTVPGRTHDYTLLKAELPPESDWFACLQVLVDLGYQGIASDYSSGDIQIPHKKPRQSKKNPDPQLTEQQKRENQALSRLRIFVENAIAGIKRYNILVHRFRNHRQRFDDQVMAVSAALWNFSLNY